MRDRIRLFMRRHQFVGVTNPNDPLEDQVTGNVVVQCDDAGFATYVPGTVDQAWQEFTDLVQGLDKLSLSWDAVNSGTSGPSTDSNPEGSNYDKGVSLDVIMNDAAFNFVNDWLIEDRCGLLNAVDVLLSDEICQKNYRVFEVKADNLTTAPFDRPCELEVKLREADAVWHCVHKTFIWDNWQHWFEDNGAKEHPCFLTAVEPRPRLISSARMGISIFGQTIPVIDAIFSENDNAFRRILNVDNFVDAPLIRDIISNACGKCGLAVDTMFHDPGNPYYNLTLYFPSSGAWHTNDADDVESPALWFHFANRWDITLAELLDKLKAVFRAEWYVTPNSTLVFRPKTTFLVTAPILDFTTGDLPVWDLEYTFSGTKKPAYGRYQYTLDPSDLATQEIANLYNDIVDYDGPANNLMLEGNVSNTLEFASTGFVRDGKARGDYMRDLINDGETVAYALVILLGVIAAALLAGVLSAGAAAALTAFLIVWIANIASKASDLRGVFGDDKYTGAVRLTSDQVGTPRLLLWDGASLERAKVVRVAPEDVVPAPFYNPLGASYLDRNTFQYNPVGGLLLFNYPMYFDSLFAGNLFDGFHDEVDNPLKSMDTHQTFSMGTDLCCDVLDALGAWEGLFAQVGSRVRLQQKANYDVLGRIEKIEITYEDARVKLVGRVQKDTPP